MLKHNPKSFSISVEAADPDTKDAVVPCSVEEVESHLRAFIAAFVRPEAQPRWREFLIERRPEWDVIARSPRGMRIYAKVQTVLRAFAADERYCTRVPNAQRTESYYADIYGGASGVYFAADTTPRRLTAAEADTKFSYDAQSALLSFEAGRQTLFFCHDGGVWRCEKAVPLTAETNHKTVKQ